ncbi:hypothetical protein [uncultured Thiodictyon sp.]|uniref:hypothetical protein n=1 Tax=uncultured Thiodictyon sp. TaxID=1846217 RepID=UPI002600E7AD|nr:hypothetical protein [uncultured Thiodictyon sp.]
MFRAVIQALTPVLEAGGQAAAGVGLAVGGVLPAVLPDPAGQVFEQGLALAVGEARAVRAGLARADRGQDPGVG